MKASEDAFALIRHFEDLKLQSYLCVAGIPTVGYGKTKGIHLGMTISTQDAEKFLSEDVARFEDYLTSALSDVEAIRQNQFDALLSWVFNIGPTLAQSSTLLKLLKKGDMQGAADELPNWNKASVLIEGRRRLRPVAGLTRRRMAERHLFLTGKLRFTF